MPLSLAPLLLACGIAHPIYCRKVFISFDLVYLFGSDLVFGIDVLGLALLDDTEGGYATANRTARGECGY